MALLTADWQSAADTDQSDSLLVPAGVNSVDEIDVADSNCQVRGADTEVVSWEE